MPVSSSEERKYFSRILLFTDEYARIVGEGFSERCSLIKIKPYETEIYEVIGGLLSRQATLTIQLSQAPSIWNSHIAPIILRSMIDLHITLAWILLEPRKRTNEYIRYGLGQEKLILEHLKKKKESESLPESWIDSTIEMKEKWLRTQRHDFLIDVNVGNMSGVHARSMAEDVGCLELYRFGYVPFSSAVHSMWPQISNFNLESCRNPLHKFHRIPAIIDDPLSIDHLLQSSKYISLSFQAVDEFFNLDVDAELPIDWSLRECKLLNQNSNSEYKKE